MRFSSLCRIFSFLARAAARHRSHYIWTIFPFIVFAIYLFIYFLHFFLVCCIIYHQSSQFAQFYETVSERPVTVGRLSPSTLKTSLKFYLSFFLLSSKWNSLRINCKIIFAIVTKTEFLDGKFYASFLAKVSYRSNHWKLQT